MGRIVHPVADPHIPVAVAVEVAAGVAHSLAEGEEVVVGVDHNPVQDGEVEVGVPRLRRTVGHNVVEQGEVVEAGEHRCLDVQLAGLPVGLRGERTMSDQLRVRSGSDQRPSWEAVARSRVVAVMSP